MKIKRVFALIPILILVLLIDEKASFSAQPKKQKRIQFQILTVEEKSDHRNVLSQTTIEGAEGTDFNINLQTGNFKMQAQFLSDLVEADKLRVRSKLNTRRFYGYSQINLPLYEEDSQNHSMQMGFDETIVLLPFGRGDDGTAMLKIEITPIILPVTSTESADTLKINIDKPLQSGEITVEAFNHPHRFQVEAILLADGQEIATGVSEILFDEEQEIVLLANEKAEKDFFEQPLKTKLSVNKYTRNHPQDLVSISYKIYRVKITTDGQSQTEIFSGSGGTILGSDLIYQLDERQLPGDKKYELKFNVRLAQSERSR